MTAPNTETTAEFRLDKSSHGRFLGRFLVVAATYIYAFSILVAYQNYLDPTWGYFGFTYSDPTAKDYLFIGFLLTLAAATLPRTFERPSSIILLFLFVVVFVPSVVITICLSANSFATHWKILLSLTVATTVCSLVSRISVTAKSKMAGLPDSTFIYTFIAIWLIIAALNIAFYHSVMGFAGIESTYEQREAGASKNALTAYTQTLFSTVINPTIFVFGLIYRKNIFIWIGIAGSLLIYAIAAQKTILLLPLIIFLFYKFLTLKNINLKTPAIPVLVLSVLMLVASLTYNSNEFVWLFAALFVFRTIAIPGLTYSQYHELFVQKGYTFWSHVKGISSLVPTPDVYVNDPLWPGLGYMVGEFAYGRSDINNNANLYSGDGVAAAGWIGVLVIGIVFAVWIKVLDIIASRWDSRFTTLAILPFAISLTNGHFFTNLLSFGGIAWILIFLFFKPTSISNA